MSRQIAKHTQQESQTATPVSSGLLQRKCACGNHTIADGGCEGCAKKRKAILQRAPSPSMGEGWGEGATVPPIVYEVLRSPGHPLDPSTRAYFEPRFGHDFSQVRVHTDAKAAESAHATNALAYTVGRDVVFAQQQYRPATINGQQLLAHEFTHVLQQSSARHSSFVDRLTLDPPHSVTEREAQRIAMEVSAGGSTVRGTASVQALHRSREAIVSRADPQAVQTIMRLGTTVATGLQFWPTNVTDTRVGPVSVQGGLLGGGASRLNIIIGENQTLRTLARQLLPLWTTATPFTPPGAVAPLPLDIITADELAQGLLVYNQYYLPVPSMTNWRSGLRFPLPVEIDEVTGVATLHPLQIRALAGAFDPAWVPQLDLRASATAHPLAATLAADVTAFIARETTALARGVHLGALALTNAVAELPFIQETFRQLGSASFDVALEFMDNLVNTEIGILAAQRDGAAILAEIRTVLAAAPAAPTADQRASLDRANRMLGLVAGAAAAAPPMAARRLAEKTVTIDTVKLDGANHDPATDMAVANAILTQCNVRVARGVDATATPIETTTWLGGNTDLRASSSCGTATLEESRLFRNASTRFGLSGRIRAFFVATYSGYSGGLAYSVPPYCATGAASAVRGMVIIQNASNRGDLAHEAVHILQNSGTHLPAPNLMSADPVAAALNNVQCTAIYRNV